MTAFVTTTLRTSTATRRDSLWHYTTAATFAVIMKSKSIWATQISCLNDHMEFRHGVRLVREAIRLYKVPLHDKDTQWLAGYVDDALENEGAEISEFFVLCMSEAKDDLSQWRAYGGGENGVAIELCTPVLQPDTQHSGYLRPVWYVENAQKGLAADIAKWTVDFSDSASAASVQTGSGGRTHSLKSGNDASYGSRRF